MNNSCEMVPLSKDVQQWVMNSNSIEDNIEKVLISLVVISFSDKPFYFSYAF